MIQIHVATRRVMAGQKVRPGTVVMMDPRQLPRSFLMDRSMRSWDGFDRRTPPEIEVMGFASGQRMCN